MQGIRLSSAGSDIGEKGSTVDLDSALPGIGDPLFRIRCESVMTFEQGVVVELAHIESRASIGPFSLLMAEATQSRLRASRSTPSWVVWDILKTIGHRPTET